MNYVKHHNVYGTEVKEIPCIVGNGEPDNTIDKIGLLYMDQDTGKIYKCTAEGWSFVNPLNLENGDGQGSLQQINVYKDINNPEQGFVESKATANGAVALGYQTIAAGEASYAEGAYTCSLGDYSHVEGEGSTANGYASHAEGCSQAQSDYSHAEGQGSVYDYAVTDSELLTLNLPQIYFNSEIDGDMQYGRNMIVIYNNQPYIATKELSFASNPNDWSLCLKDEDNKWVISDSRYSHAEGSRTLAKNLASHSEGLEAKALGSASHAEGNKTIAQGHDSHAEGLETIAYKTWSHSEGYKTSALGVASHVEGSRTIAAGRRSHAENSYTIAYGDNSHAEGYGGEQTQTIILSGDKNQLSYNFASEFTEEELINGIVVYNNMTAKIISCRDGEIVVDRTLSEYLNLKYAECKLYQFGSLGEYSHSEGHKTKSIGIASHAEGTETQAIGHASHSEGHSTIANETYSHAEGHKTQANGEASHAEGSFTIANGRRSHTEGYQTTASADHSHAEGYNTTASGVAAHAEGSSAVAKEPYSHAEGLIAVASGVASHAEGYLTEASADHSHAEGYNTTASGTSAHAEGSSAIAIGSYSHAEGLNTIASGKRAHAEGDQTEASGIAAHAEGSNTIASGDRSHAEGYKTIASGNSQHVEGKYNIKDTENKYAHIVGNGDSATRSNAHTLDWDGNAWFAGNVNATAVYGAVWNDYAEYRDQIETIEPGYCVVSADNGQVSKTTEKFQVCDGIVSDTFGFAIGETDNCKTPLAVAGRVLAYCEGDRLDYHAGDTVCAGPDGKVTKMTREEIREWPDRIVGTVSEIPMYETWGTGNVAVNGRIWIKIK